LHNLVLTGKTAGDMIKWDGSKWVNFKGVSGTFTAGAQTITVTNGVITNIA